MAFHSNDVDVMIDENPSLTEAQAEERLADNLAKRTAKTAAETPQRPRLFGNLRKQEEPEENEDDERSRPDRQGPGA